MRSSHEVYWERHQAYVRLREVGYWLARIPLLAPIGHWFIDTYELRRRELVIESWGRRK